MSGRYPVLGLARARAAWFRDVSRWSSSAALPVEFVKCVSVAELRARLGSGRLWSALLVDGALPAVDRDLVDEARQLGCAVLVVDDGRAVRDWPGLGVSAVLQEPLRPPEVLAALEEHGFSLAPAPGALDLGRQLGATPGHDDDAAAPREVHGRRGPRGWLVAVTGPPGSGTSTLAAALAQGLAELDAWAPVALADLALHADQALRHDLGDVVPGLQELIEAHRSGTVAAEEVRATLFHVPAVGYRLLAGLRRHRDWAALRPRATEAALDGLVDAFATTVADVDADLEGQDECGSADVEERNHLARAAIARADLVVVTGLPSTVGVHRLVRTLDDLVAYGVDPRRILTVVDRAPRSWSARAEVADAVAHLAGAALSPGTGLAAPVFVGGRRRLEGVVRDGAPLPRAVAGAVSRPVAALLERLATLPAPGSAPIEDPVAVRPGSLGVSRG